MPNPESGASIRQPHSRTDVQDQPTYLTYPPMEPWNAHLPVRQVYVLEVNLVVRTANVSTGQPGGQPLANHDIGQLSGQLYGNP